MKVLVTGADGFVGKALCRRLERDFEVLRCTRAVTGDVGPDTRWERLLDGVDYVVHLAARVHVLRESEPDPLSAFRHVNVEGTRALARQAAASVRRFVYLSTIGVHGDRTAPGEAISETSPIRPHNDYARSKWEGEEALRSAAAGSGMEWTVLRPPLVFGPAAPGNFGALLRISRSGLPLPLASVHNARSLLFVGNLCDLIAAALTAPAAANRAFTVCDGAPVSTAELLRGLARAQGRKARLFPFPVPILNALATATGRGRQFAQLTGDLVVDGSQARAALSWTSRYEPEEAYRACVTGLVDDSSVVSGRTAP